MPEIPQHNAPSVPDGRHLCPCCNGSRESASGGPCLFCDATGTIEDPPQADEAMVPCTTCDGTGQTMHRGETHRGYDDPDYMDT